jgi:hypothetical protein
MNLVEKVILEWSYRCEKGYPDLSNEKDMELFESLFGFRLNEAVLDWKEFSEASRKYSRLRLLDDKIENKDPFEFLDGSQSALTYTDDSYAPLFHSMEVDAIKKIGGSRINHFPFFKDQEGNDVSFSALKKTKEFGGSGGSKKEKNERQEHGLINAINAVPGVKTLKGTNGVEITGVQSAVKVEGENAFGKEPYADVILKVKGQDIKVSAKGNDAPTLAGGGLTGMSAMATTNPQIRDWLVDFYEDAYQFYKKRIEANNLEGVNLAGNKLVPDVSRKIPENILKTVIEGTAAMGGPIDYYYKGVMDVNFEVEGNTVHLKNGKFVSVDDFIAQHNGSLYAHLRKRDGDYYFTDSMQEKFGIVFRSIFKKKENSSGSQARFGTLDKIRGIEI